MKKKIYINENFSNRNSNIDTERVDYIKWTYDEYEPDEDEYESEEERLELIKDNSTINLKCFDSEREHIGWMDGLSLDDIENEFGEYTANEIKNGIEMGFDSGDVDEIIDSRNSEIDIENAEEVNRIAKQYFTTFEEYQKGMRGYILTDGDIIYFGDNMDHISINRVGDIKIGKFVSLGNIRIGTESIYLEKKPTREQIYILKQMLRENQNIYIDVVKYSEGYTYSDNVFSVKYENCSENVDYIINQLLRYFDEGIKPDAIFEERKFKIEKNKLIEMIKESFKGVLK